MSAPQARLSYRLLGMVEVVRDGRVARLGGLKPRSVLASLLLEANRMVTDERLIADVWGEDVPATVRAQLYTLASGLRKRLGAAVIERRPQGYLIAVRPGQLDLDVFEDAVAAGRKASADGDLVGAVGEFRRACGLWRGPPLGGVTETMAGRAGPWLQERRLNALEERMQAELALGNHEEIIGELWSSVTDFPLRERLRAKLMLALYRSGQVAEAVEVYQAGRRLLIDELGVEPGSELQELHRAILAGDPGLAGPRPRQVVITRTEGAAHGEQPMPPALLPPDVADFTGRQTDIRELVTLLERDDANSSPTAPVVAVVTGVPGVGKTALVVHVAQSVRERFPDGQLYADLHGTATTPADPREVLAGFLRGLGVYPPALPGDLQERIGLYRSLLGRRQMLVVLDNALDAAQVAPLVPGGPGCAVLVTSRARLTGLPGARQIELAALDRRAAVELLANLAGEAKARIDAEPDAAGELADLCGRLPLALRIAAARLAAKPHWRPATLVSRLTGERSRLDELTHAHLEVRAGLTSSYRALGARVRLMFRRLAMLEVPDFACWVGAALLDTSPDDAEDVIERLVDARLLDAVPGDSAGQVRYRFHDLTRLFAREQAEKDPPADRRNALTRAFGGWLALVQQAHTLVYGSGFAVVHGAAPRWCPDPAYTDALLADPLAWYDSERVALVAIVRQSARTGMDEVCWDLAVTATVIFRARHHYDEWRVTHDHALAATRRAGNRRGQAAVLAMLGGLHLAEQRCPDAFRTLEPALKMFEEVGDRYGHALTLLLMMLVDLSRGDDDAALIRCHTARAALRAVGDSGLEALTLTRIGQIRHNRGDTAAARRCMEQALTLIRRAGGRDCVQVLHWIGDFFLDQEQLDPAEKTFRQLAEMTVQVGDAQAEAAALSGLGEIRFRQGDHDAANRMLERALLLAGGAGEPLLHTRILVTLGELCRTRRDYAAAGVHLAQAAELSRQSHIPLWRARALRALGDLHHSTGDVLAAGNLWSQALAVLPNDVSPEAREIRARLGNDRPAPPRP